MQAHLDVLQLTLEISRDPQATWAKSAGAWPDAGTKALFAAVAGQSPFALSENPDGERLRAQAFRVMALRPLQSLLGRAFRLARSPAAVLRPMLMLGLVAAVLTLPIDQPRAQEALQMSAADRRSERFADSIALSNLGLDLATIDACEDVERLWSAVRKLVLPGHVTAATQQRILRRVWMVDPDIRSGSVVDATMN